MTLNYKDRGPTTARVKVPIGAGIPRFLRIGGLDRFVPLEQVISNNLDLLFPRMNVESCEPFYVTRNANLARESDVADDLLAMIESEVRERRFAPIVRVKIQRGMDPYRRGWLAAELGLDPDTDVFESESMLAMRHLFEIASLEFPALRDPPTHPADHGGLVDERSIIYAIRNAGSILLQHPYESFSNSVERFVAEASADPKVRAIKMTLYRTSGETKILDYLLDAARNGKQVAVVVELQARFDEAANIRWASRLEEAGIHVTYGVMGLKTHCKVILVVRQGLLRPAPVRARGHRQLPRGDRSALRRPRAVDLRRGDRPRSRGAVQLPHHRIHAHPPLREAPVRAEAAQALGAVEDQP